MIKFKDMEKNRKAYTSPQVSIEIVYLESSIAAASTGARINPGLNSNANTPEIEQWENQTGFSNDLNL